MDMQVLVSNFEFSEKFDNKEGWSALFNSGLKLIFGSGEYDQESNFQSFLDTVKLANNEKTYQE